MAPLSYLRRVQQVLSDVAKDHKDFISLKDLILRVRGMRDLRSSSYVYSPFRIALRAAINHEMDSGRLASDLVNYVFRLTPTGLAFYTELVLPPVVRRTYPSGPRPSVKAEAIAEYRKLATLLQPIKTIVQERTFGNLRASAVDNLPRTLCGFIDSVDGLRVENSDISCRLSDLSWELDALLVGDDEGASSTNNILGSL